MGRIIVNLDVEMAKRKISLGELAERIDLTQANLSILKTGKARAIRFTTLEAICRELQCQPGDISPKGPIELTLRGIFTFLPFTHQCNSLHPAQ